MNKMLKTHVVVISLCLCANLLLAGCSHNAHPTGKPLPQLSFDHLNPYAIHGGAVRIQQSFVEHPQSKAISTTFPIVPAELLQRYAAKRFVTQQNANGQHGEHGEHGEHGQQHRQLGVQDRLVFDIKDASLSRMSDPEGLVNFFSGLAEDYYTLHIDIAMTPIRADGHRAAPFTVKLNRRLSLAHNLSLAERQFRQFEFLETALTDIDQSITQLVKHKLTAQYF
jgi:hypothetical protein